MPKIFTEDDEKVIKEKMIKTARDLFSQFGLKKTSIADITSKVGIAQGTFYSFFNSKEELYFEIMEREEVVREEIIDHVMKNAQNPQEGVKSIILKGYEFIDKNEFIRGIYEHGDMEQLMRKIPQERLLEHMESDKEYIVKLIELWKSKGIEINISADVISGFIRSLFMISFFKDQIGHDVYDDVVQLLAETVSKGIFPALKGEKND